MNEYRVFMEAKMGDKYYTITELATEFGVSRQTVYNWIGAGRFPNKFEVGTNDTTLIPTSDVEAVRKEEAEKLLERLNRLGFQTVPA